MDEEQRKELARQRLLQRRARNAGMTVDEYIAQTNPGQQTRPSDEDRQPQRTPKKQASHTGKQRKPQQAKESGKSQTKKKSSKTITLPLLGKVRKSFAIRALVVLLAVVFILGVTIRSCTAPASSGANDSSASTPASASSQAAPELEPIDEYNTEELEWMLGEETAQTLIERAATDEDINWIASHVDEYAIEDFEVQQKILTLAANDKAATYYVRHFPDSYPTDDQNDDTSVAIDDGLAGTKFETKVPHLYQWDPRWAYCVYSSTTFGLTGCGPTCLAMVSQALTGSDLTPWDMAERAMEYGFMSEYQGTDSSFFSYEASVEGFSCWAMFVSGDAIRSVLESGDVIIANLGPGYFTRYGHFFVLAGLDENGDVIVNDPYSVVRSSQTWDADFIASEAMALFACS